MKHFTLHTAVAAAAILGLAACGGKTAPETETQTTPETKVEAPVSGDDAAAAPTPSADVKLPDCSVESSEDEGLPDCSLTPSSGDGSVLTVSFGEQENDGTPITINVIKANGNTVQTIEEKAEQLYTKPRLIDINSDGTDELLVPLMTGNVNTVYSLWTRASGSPIYKNAGELSGVGVDVLSGNMFSMASRNSAADWSTEFYTLSADGALQGVAVSEQNLADDTCTVTDTGGLAALGLTDEDAKIAFCTVS